MPRTISTSPRKAKAMPGCRPVFSKYHSRIPGDSFSLPSNQCSPHHLSTCIKEFKKRRQALRRRQRASSYSEKVPGCVRFQFLHELNEDSHSRTMKGRKRQSEVDCPRLTDGMSQDRGFRYICSFPRLTLKQYVCWLCEGCAPQNVLVTIKEACGLGLMMTAQPTREDLSHTPQAMFGSWYAVGICKTALPGRTRTP